MPYRQYAQRPDRRPQSPTAFPHVHLYPQNAKLHGLVRPREGHTENCTSNRPPPTRGKKIAHYPRRSAAAEHVEAVFMRGNEALTSVRHARKFGGRKSSGRQ